MVSPSLVFVTRDLNLGLFDHKINAFQGLVVIVEYLYAKFDIVRKDRQTCKRLPLA